MNWNHDISAAPKGKTVKVTRKVKTTDGLVDREVDEVHPVSVLLASTDGNVYHSRWIEPTSATPSGRWSGFPANAKTIAAWAPWPTYEPSRSAELHAAAADIISHLHLEDCGSGQ